jgi:hypothetical protein
MGPLAAQSRWTGYGKPPGVRDKTTSCGPVSLQRDTGLRAPRRPTRPQPVVGAWRVVVSLIRRSSTGSMSSFPASSSIAVGAAHFYSYRHATGHAGNRPLDRFGLYRGLRVRIWRSGVYLPSTASTALDIVAVGAPVVVFKSTTSPTNADRMPSKHWLKPHCCMRARLARPC